MRVVELGDVNSDRGGQLPEGAWVACAIGPDSLVDAVRVDGVTLGARAVLPCSRQPRIERVRGPRTGTLTDNANNRCQLVLFERGDAVPGVASPRRPVQRFRDLPAAVVASWTRVLRVPFAGRRYAAFHMTGKVGQSFDWALVGVKYSAIGSTATEPHVADLETGTHLVVASVSGAEAALTKLVGGSDEFEDGDEVELWFKQAGANAFHAIGEAFDFGGQ